MNNCSIIGWILFLFVPPCIWAQGDVSPMHVDHLTIEEALSHNTVSCILQDRHGYIWVGTTNGLNKYDGYSFEVYRTNAQSDGKRGFIGKSVSSLLEDSKGNLWVGMQKQGVNFRSAASDHFKNLQTDSAFAPILGYDISHMYEDKSGNIWITTIGRGVLRYDPTEKTSRLYTAENSGLNNNLAFDVIEDSFGSIWVATAGVGLNLLQKTGRFSQAPSLIPGQGDIGGYKKTLLLDKEFIWIGTQGTGLYRMNTRDKTYVHFAYAEGDRDLGSNGILDIHKARDGRLYIATDGAGLNIYDETHDELSNYTHESRNATSLNSNALTSIGEDRSGNIWIGTFNGGINVFKKHKTRFEFITPNAGPEEILASSSVLAIHQSKNEQIWVGTDGGGLYRLHPQNEGYLDLVYKHEANNVRSLSGNVVKTIFEDSRGYLWIGTFSAGLNRYDPKTHAFRQYTYQFDDPNSLTHNNVWTLAESKDGRLWIGALGGGVNVWNPQTDNFTAFMPIENDPKSLADANIMSVFIDTDDRVWIGTKDLGLDLWEEDTEEFQHFRFDPEDSLSISNNEIRAIFQDSKGEIWIGTEGGGLNRWLGDGSFERFGKNKGLIANSVMGITEDEEGLLWISTFEGISRFDPQSHTFRNFDFHVDQNSNQFNQMAILTAKNGKLFFGGINGLNSIRLDQIKEKQAVPGLLFTDFKVFNERIPVGKLPDGRTILQEPIETAKHIQLNYFDNSFSFAFSSIDYTHPSENIFSYKMEGFDEHWQNTSEGQHTATYTNLDPGTYTFKVQHEKAEASIIVHISPPFWQTLWFRALVLLILLGIAYSAIYLIIKRREATQKQRMEKAKGEIIRLKNEKLAAELDAKNSKLMFSAVQMAHKNEILTDVKKEIKDLELPPDKQLRQTLRMIDRELESENYWNEFNLYFNQVDKDFGPSLLKKHPELTPNDLRMCALIRINLTTKEIASLLNISQRGVEQSRYRLKKRLGLGNQDHLANYITRFESDSKT